MQKTLKTQLNDSNFLLLFGSNLLPKYVTFAKPNQPTSSVNSSVLEQLFNNYFTSLRRVQDTPDQTNKEPCNADDFANFSKLCADYDPFNEFLLLVSVSVESVANNLLVCKEMRQRRSSSMYVLKYMKMGLVNRRPVRLKNEEPGKTLILTSMKEDGSKHKCGIADLEHRITNEENRELFLANIVSIKCLL